MVRGLMARHACAAAIAVFGACGTGRAAVNLLADPGFEVATGAADASDGDKYGANGWNAFGDGAYTTASVHFEGAQAFKSFNAYNGVNQGFAVTPGQTYTATVYSMDSSSDKEANGNVNDLELNFFTSGTQPLDYGTASFNTTAVIAVSDTSPVDQWVKGTVTATVPAGYSYMLFQINLSATNGGAAFWDSASLTQNAVPEPASLGALALVGGIAAARRRRAR